MGILILLTLAAGLIFLFGTIALVHIITHPDRRTYASALALGLPIDPSEMGLQFEEKQIDLDDGTSTIAWSIQGEKPDGPVVIITHGWSNSRYGAQLKALRLSPWASRLIVYDMRGQGDSTAHRCELGASEPHDLWQVVQAFDDGRTPLVFFGSSMGAGISLDAAVHAPHEFESRVIGVIIDGIYRRPMEPVAGHLRLRGWPAQPFTWFAELYLRWYYAIGRVYDRVTLASRLQCPLLVFHGCKDPICLMDSARDVAAAAPQGTLVEFAEGGHGGLPKVDEPRYREALNTFFNTLTRDSESDKMKQTPALASVEGVLQS